MLHQGILVTGFKTSFIHNRHHYFLRQILNFEIDLVAILPKIFKADILIVLDSTSIARAGQYS